METHLTLKDYLVLLTSKTPNAYNHTRSAYLTRDLEKKDGLVLIDNLEFFLYVAIPENLDPYLLYEEMMRCYYTSLYSKANQLSLLEEIELREAEVEMMRKSGDRSEAVLDQIERKTKEAMFLQKKFYNMVHNRTIHENYKSLLYDIGDLKGEKRLRFLRRGLKQNEYFFIREMKEFFVPRHVRIAKKIKSTRQWRFTFDNHRILQFFLSKFRKPLEIGRYYEDSRLIPGIDYTIQILDGDSEDPSLYHGGGGNSHDHYITGQTRHFPEEAYLYRWTFPTSSVTQVNECLIEPVFQSNLSTSLEEFQERVVRVRREYLSHIGVSFDSVDLGVEIKLVHLNEKKSLLALDTRAKEKKSPVIKEEIIHEKSTAMKRKVYIGKEGVKPLQQSSLSFVVIDNEKKRKLS